MKFPMVVLVEFGLKKNCFVKAECYAHCPFICTWDYTPSVHSDYTQFAFQVTVRIWGARPVGLSQSCSFSFLLKQGGKIACLVVGFSLSWFNIAFVQERQGKSRPIFGNWSNTEPDKSWNPPTTIITLSPHAQFEPKHFLNVGPFIKAIKPRKEHIICLGFWTCDFQLNMLN